MSISTGTRTTTPFIGDGTTVALPFAFKVFAAADVVVYQATDLGIQSTKTLTTDYTVFLNADQNTSPGGVVTMTVAAPLDYATVISSLVAQTQGVQLAQNGGFSSQVINDALDKLTILAQQNNLVDQLSVKIPQTDGLGLTTTLPTAALRANRALVFDASGNIGVSVDNYVNQTAAAAASAAAAAVSAGAAASSASAAAGSASSAGTSATASAASATAASSSASAASTSASGASTSATAAASSASAASTSASGASTSATNAAASAATATTQASAASTSATNAASSASAASTSATNAAASATSASGSATAAATSATNASTSETNAAASAVAAAASAAAASAAAAGISMKSSCRIASTTALTVTYANGASGVGATLTNAGAQAAISLDGVSPNVGERVLIKDQVSGLQNGIYTVTTVGTGATNWVLTRAADYDQAAEVIEGTATIIEEGTTNASHIYVMTHNGAITMGTTSIDWTSLTANATTANTLTTPRAIGGVNFDGSAAITPQQIQPASEASDTTCFPLFVNTASGTAQQPKYNASFGYNASANAITGVAFQGSQVTEGFGGTNQSTYTKGDLLYASAANTLSKLGIGSTGQVLAIAGGVPAWGTGITPIGYNAQTTTYAPIAGDNGKVLAFTGSSNATWTFTSAATLGAGWWCIIENQGTSNALLPLLSSSGTIDGISGYTMYPGEARLFFSDGTNFRSVVLNVFSMLFSSSGSFIVPPGYKTFETEIWSSGQAGASRTTTGNAGGGAGGLYGYLRLRASALVAAGSSETITVGGTAAGVTGNTNGTLANASSITVNGVLFSPLGIANTGSLQTAAINAAVSSAAAGGQISLYPVYPVATGWSGYAPTGGDVTVGNVPESPNSSLTLYGNSILCGGSGGACASTAGGVRTGGTSLLAGAGGAGGLNTGGNGTNGAVPAGGGGGAVQGGTSGSGGAGQFIIRGIV